MPVDVHHLKIACNFVGSPSLFCYVQPILSKESEKLDSFSNKAQIFKTFHRSAPVSARSTGGIHHLCSNGQVASCVMPHEMEKLGERVNSINSIPHLSTFQAEFCLGF